MTSAEVRFAAAFCVLSAVVATLVIKLFHLSGDAIVLVATVGAGLNGLMAGELSAREARRKRGRVH